jgi:cysteine desulfurase/selenocysteine lyase
VTASSPRSQAPYDVELVRKDFPILATESRGKPLVYFDTAASAQKPQVVIDAVVDFYTHGYANIHRGLYQLSVRATQLFEEGRERVRGFLNAADEREIVFVRNATEAINLVSMSWGRQEVGEGDEIVISALEHHANIVPWQQLCAEKGAHLRVVPVNDRGELEPGAFETLLGDRTKLVAISHVSNALGTINPAKELVEAAHARGIPVLLDGAQAVPHMAVDVQDLDCDFYVFSGHKLFAPSGIGALYGKLPILESMPPFMTGGDMIESVTFEKTTFKAPPHRFEAGTPDIAGVIGLAAAIDYLEGIGLERIAAWEQELLVQATSALEEIPGLRIVGTAAQKAAVISFVLEAAHPHDVATILDQEGVAVRAGHHCAQPVMERFGVPATTRASFSLYNTREEVDVLVGAIHRVGELFT